MANNPKRGQRLKPVTKAKTTRISSPVKAAIDLMIHHGLTRPQAAQQVGLKDNSLYIALRKPDVLSYKTRVLREHREALAEKSLNRIDWLAEGAKNDSTKLQANKILLEQDDRFRPAPPSFNVQTNISLGVTPGYVIDLSSDDMILDQAPDT